jgi:2-dehydropantoate 2-reductase
LTLAVFGAGSIGSLFGGRVSLLSPGERKDYEPIALVGRKQHVDVINRHGLVINSFSGNLWVKQLEAVTDLEQVERLKYILVSCKAYDNGTASSILKANDNGKMKVFILQNGVGNEKSFLPEFKGRIYRLTTTEAARLKHPGVVNHISSGLTVLGRYEGRLDNTGKRFASLLSSAGFKTELTRNLDEPVWTKFLINIPINPLGALYRLKNGELLKHERVMSRFERLVAETLELFDRLKIKTAFNDPLEEIKEITRKTAQNKCSMLQDLERGRKTEIDFLNGQVVKKGQEIGLKTPENLEVYRRIKRLEVLNPWSLVA